LPKIIKGIISALDFELSEEPISNDFRKYLEELSEKFNKRELKDSSQIVTSFLEKGDPFNRVVGKGNIVQEIKRIAHKYVVELHNIKEREVNLKERGLNKNFPPGECIVDILKRDTRPMYIIALVGPYGSGKTLLANCLSIYLQKLFDGIGFRPPDYVAIPDNNFSRGFRIDSLPTPQGEMELKKYLKRQSILGKIKKGSIWGLIASAAFTLLYQTLWFIKSESKYIKDWLLNIGMNIWYDILRYASVVEIAFFTYMIGFAYWYMKRNQSKRPNIISYGRVMPSILIGGESREELEGVYDDSLDRPPQEKILKRSKALEANMKILPIENVAALKEDAQLFLAQLIEEKEIYFAGLPNDYREFFYTLVVVGINPDQIHKVHPALLNRLNYGEQFKSLNTLCESSSFYDEVSNILLINNTEVVEGNDINKAHFLTYLAWRIKENGGRPWKLEAMKTFMDYSSCLAEDKDKLYVSRKIIKLIDKVEEVAKSERSPYVEKEHVKETIKTFRSSMQKLLEEKIKELYSTYPPLLQGSEVGSVNCLLLHQETIKEGEESYLQSEDYVGYICKINTVVEKVSGNKGEIKIISNGLTEDEKRHYQDSLRMLFAKDEELADYYQYFNIYVSVPCLKNDDSLLAGMYVSAKSAIKECPINQNYILSIKLTEDGRITSLPRLNRRLFYLEGIGKDVVVSKEDYNKRIPANYYDKLQFHTVEKLQEIEKLLRCQK
jgi:hypothetical protein